MINIKFINLSCGSSYFEKCLVENCSFENITFKGTQFENCQFKNCRFIDCDFNEADAIELCHFHKSIFEDMMNNGLLFTSMLIDSTFSNSKKSIKFEGEVHFHDIFDQINTFHIGVS